MLVQLMWSLPAHHLGGTLVELQPDVARDMSLRLRDQVFEPGDLFRQRDVLQRLVRLEQEHSGGRLVDLARLDADEAVLEMVDPAHSILPTDAVQSGHKLERRNRLAVE